MLVRVQEPVVECTPQIQWLLQLKPLGMALPYNSSNPAVSKDKQDECQAVGTAMQQPLAKDLKPLDIVTRKFGNARRLIAVLEDPPMQSPGHRKGGKYHINY